MTSLSHIILALALGYALIGGLLLAVLVFARIPWPIKATAIAMTSAFYIVVFFSVRGLMGWGAIDPLPPYFKLLGARIVEPHSLAGDDGAIYLWVEELDADNYPSGAPRAFRLPYSVKIAEKAEVAIKASADGKPQGGRTADFGSGAGGASLPTGREATPTVIITTAGGDPSGGGALDASAVAGQPEGVQFAPLLPPRAPPKDAR